MMREIAKGNPLLGLQMKQDKSLLAVEESSTPKKKAPKK